MRLFQIRSTDKFVGSYGRNRSNTGKKKQRRKRSCHRERERRFERGRQSYKMLSPAYFVLQADKNSIISKLFIFLLDANKNVLRIYRSWLTKVKETVEVKFKKTLKGTH